MPFFHLSVFILNVYVCYLNWLSLWCFSIIFSWIYNLAYMNKSVVHHNGPKDAEMRDEAEMEQVYHCSAVNVRGEG